MEAKEKEVTEAKQQLKEKEELVEKMSQQLSNLQAKEKELSEALELETKKVTYHASCVKGCKIHHAAKFSMSNYDRLLLGSRVSFLP